MRGHVFPTVLVCLFLAICVAPQKVDDAASSVSINDREALLRLVVESDRDRSVPAHVELIDPVDAVRSTSVQRQVSLRDGKQMVEFRLPVESDAAGTNDDLTWYRLRYTVGDATGIIAMSQLIPDLFELRIIAANDLLTGMTYRVRVLAFNPFNDSPAAGVHVDTIVALDLRGEADRQLTLRGQGVTDTQGFAVIDMAIPSEAELDHDGEIKVVGRKNGLVREAEEELNTVVDDTRVLAMTDKPIYQPGQLLNLRAIVLKGSEAKVIVPNSEVEFRILDEDDTLLYREKTMSSEYGIAVVSWRIPANARLGEYTIDMRGPGGSEIGRQQVKVSRYDLPNFAVMAKSLKPYHLPSDKQAEVEIRADYLFGKPVTKGKVRVVEENSREWNWKEQKYEIDEGDVREGELDADGKFTARFDLAEAHDDIKDDDWRRYKDIKFAAYVTDLTTNKTEQRRFDVRVSREPIHVYLMETRGFGNSRLPMVGYVSAFYADGTPAECDVEIKASEEDADKFRTVARVRTNAYGAARVSMPRPAIGDPDDDLDFRLIAKDNDGRRGTAEENVYFDGDDEGIRVFTDRTIYKPGETMRVKLLSTVKSGTAYVDIVRGWSVVDSRTIAFTDGKAELEVPYNDQFLGPLKISVFMEDPNDDDDLIEGNRGVIFPAKEGINVEASFDKAIYRPNEEATVKFGVVDAVGRAVAGALGVVIFDKAVEERARTDADFGGMFRGLSDWLGYGGGFGSINVKDLNDLDLTKPISDEMQLVAEVILRDGYYMPNVFRSRRYYDEAGKVFGGIIANQMNPIAVSLQNAYTTRNHLHPVDDASLRNILDAYRVDLAAMRDPWGTAYRPEFSIANDKDVVTIRTAGPDKTFGTKDDFNPYSDGFAYFTPIGKTIDAAIKNYNARTGRFIRDEKTLLAELGVRELQDRYGRPYHFGFSANGRNIVATVRSNGPDGKHEEYYYKGDDFQVWSSSIDMFAAVERKLSAIQTSLKVAPITEAEFIATLKRGGVNFNELRDGNGKPLYINVEKRSRYWDKITFESTQTYGDQRRVERRIVTPVTQQIVQFTIRGYGSDKKQGTWDDTIFTQFVHVLSEQSKDDIKPVPVTQPIVYGVNAGAIAGVVTDANGAVIPSATVTATNSTTRMARSSTANEDGRFLIANLAAGKYSIKAEATGFQASVIDSIPVMAGTTVSIDIILEVGSVSSVVSVMSDAAVIDQTDASLSTTVNSRQIMGLPLNGRNAMSLMVLKPGVQAITKSATDDERAGTDQQTSTPRLREYFPETLLWQPEVITNADGRAQLAFRVADNITTWKMYTIASTKNGKIGFAEKEVAAFQAFFVDLDPPKFLTTGDEIFLPTQVRNYTEANQAVKVTMSTAEWFSLLSAPETRITVASGGSENAVFGFKATAAVMEGKQRVTATAQTDSDAIERPVTVRPDGREIVRTDSRYFTGSETFDLVFPPNALADTQKAELKIYPNLMAHVAESIEGLLKRPYGCGEQTVSSTYPNLMILKFAGGGSEARHISETVERKAKKYLQTGYERLLGYQVADGGFSYWGGSDPADFALTAYALRFLADASDFVAVDADVVKRAEDWLIKQQRADGSWGKHYTWQQEEDLNRTKATTTYIARTLAMNKRVGRAALSDSLAKALAYLKDRNAEIDDPYSLSLLGLAALDSGDRQLAETIAARLGVLAKSEAGGLYWNLEANTAFNGWGTAGRIETTALATQLLLKLNGDDALAAKGMVYLLRNKDRYGVWYSTQTTINVLDAFVTAMKTSSPEGGSQIDVVLNGETIRTIDIAADKLDQITVDLGDKLNSGQNAVELRSATRSPLMAQIVADHYLDWADADRSGRDVNESRALRLDYKCDRAAAAIMQEINCSVEAERIGYRGYGMLLAEIGIPPGADVSRESLQAAMENEPSINRYDILPDRIVLYMWSRSGGVKFNFKFRPRYGINAQTPASTVYDYYNPEAQATLAPLRFQVK